MGGVLEKLYNFYQQKCNCCISSKTKIGNGLRLPHPLGIVISPYAEIGDYCTIYHNVTIGANEHRNNYCLAPRIGNGVYIGAGATIIGDIQIGNNVIIGANSTITKNIPDYCIVVADNKMINSIIERNPHPLL